MGGGDGWTVVLVGRTGNGKSATGNSILGQEAFASRLCSSGVTMTTKLQTREFHEEGKLINVIDTPGLFDTWVGSEYVRNEIIKCIELARDGVHAVLLVFSVGSRFSKEEESAFQSLQAVFGPRITDYVIVVFTGEDLLEDNEETLESYLGRGCPEPLQKILDACKGRCVLFDNKTKDDRKKAKQRRSVLDLVDKVVEMNAGPFTYDLLLKSTKETKKPGDQEQLGSSSKGYKSIKEEGPKESEERTDKSYEEQVMKRIAEVIELRLKELSEATQRLEQQLAEEKAARIKADEAARDGQQKANDELRELREKLERAVRENEELQNKGCAIL